jgi:hypothetical protein
MAVETFSEAWQLGWRITARCAWDKREGMKSARPCVYTYDLDLSHAEGATRSKSASVKGLSSSSGNVYFVFDQFTQVSSAYLGKWSYRLRY